jgi:hypothetical protein
MRDLAEKVDREPFAALAQRRRLISVGAKRKESPQTDHHLIVWTVNNSVLKEDGPIY